MKLVTVFKFYKVKSVAIALFKKLNRRILGMTIFRTPAGESSNFTRIFLYTVSQKVI